MGKNIPTLTIWTTTAFAPAHDCWGSDPTPSPVRTGASSWWWDHTDSCSRRSSPRKAGVCSAMQLVLHHPVPTQDTRPDPTPPGMAWKTPSGWAWQDLGLGENLNGFFWDRVSALLNNTRITKKVFDFFFFLTCRGSLIWQIFARHTTLLVFFC